MTLTLTLGKALQYAADELRDDPIFVRPIVEKSWWAAASCKCSKCISESSDICKCIYSDTFPEALECVGENARRDEEVAIVVLASLKSSQISVQTLLECKGEACQPGTCVNWCERL